jgi:hypothetical protein
VRAIESCRGGWCDVEVEVIQGVGDFGAVVVVAGVVADSAGVAGG